MPNYKQIHTGEVISESCYRKLPILLQKNYTKIEDEPTHFVDDTDDRYSLTPLIAMTAATEMLSNDLDTTIYDSSIGMSSSPDYSSSSIDTSSNSFSGFDGGSTGDGGSTDSW